MSSTYDVNAAIAKPNLLASVQQGYAFGTNQRLQREQEQRQNQLSSLAPAVIDGDPAAYSEAAAIDPQAAQGFQAAGDSQLRRLRGGMKYLKEAMDSGNPQRIAAAEAVVGPYMSKFAGKPWQPGALTADPAAFENAYARLAMLPQEPDQGRDGKVVGNSLVDPRTGQVIYQGPDVPVNAQIVEIADGRGGKQQAMFDPRTRQVMELPRPGSAPQGAPASRSPQGFATAQDEQGQPDPTMAALPESEQIKASQLAAAGRSFHVSGGRVIEGESGGLRPPAQPPAPQVDPSRVPIGQYGGGDERMPGGYGYTPPKPRPSEGAAVTLSAEEVASLGFPVGSVIQRKPNGSLDKVFTPTERDANGGRALPASVVNDLSKDAEKLTTLTDLTSSFRPEFAGNVVGGNMENLAGRLGGERVGLTSQGQSQWWQQYDRLKNVVRNELFGAALTATEQAAFEAADITPNMDPTIVQANLRKQGEIVGRALDRKAAVWKSQGFNPDAVINATTVPGARAPGTAGQPGSKAAQDLSDDELLRELGL